MKFRIRAQVKHTETATLRRYKSDCGGYAVIEVKSLLGLTSRWLAAKRDGPGEFVMSNHRTRKAAEVACAIDAARAAREVAAQM